MLKLQLQAGDRADEEASLTAKRLVALRAELVEKIRISDDLQHEIGSCKQTAMDLKEQLSVLQIENHSLDHQLALARKELGRIQIDFTDISEENQWLQERARIPEGGDVVQLRETVCCMSLKAFNLRFTDRSILHFI